jgi:DNA primase
LIDREKIDEINRQTDIVALVGQYVNLKKLGRNYRGLCPFHSEKNPSFYVNPEKGIYYCFGCQKGGNAVSFLMEYEKLDFPEAIKRLARNLGIEIDTTRNLRYKELYDVNEQASLFYAQCLNRDIGRRGQEYLQKRKLNLEKLKAFRLGYAPSSGGLVTFMRQKGFSIDRLNKAGLLATNRELFRDRLIFPIFNLSGRIIGFGGRGIDDQIQPKYLNSPETPIFKKGEGLYGLYQSKERVREKGEVLLVEGYFDLLSVYQHGFENMCAPLGTALTENQAMLLARFAKKVMILFDGDLSGLKAALRAVGLLINAQVDVHVVVLPSDSDPDSIVNEKGMDALKAYIADAVDFFHFYRKVVKTETLEQEIALIKDLIQIISRIQDPIRFDRYLKHIAHVFDIKVETIQREMEEKTKVAQKPAGNTKVSQEEKLMAMILNGYEHISLVKEHLDPQDFSEEGVKRLFTKLIKEEDFDISDLSDMVDENLKGKLLSVLMKEEPVSRESMMEAIRTYKGRIEKRRLMRKISEAIARGDETERQKYYKELDILKKQLLNIEAGNETDNGQ